MVARFLGDLWSPGSCDVVAVRVLGEGGWGVLVAVRVPGEGPW